MAKNYPQKQFQFMTLTGKQNKYIQNSPQLTNNCSVHRIHTLPTLQYLLQKSNNNFRLDHIELSDRLQKWNTQLSLKINLSTDQIGHNFKNIQNLDHSMNSRMKNVLFDLQTADKNTLKQFSSDKISPKTAQIMDFCLKQTTKDKHSLQYIQNRIQTNQRQMFKTTTSNQCRLNDVITALNEIMEQMDNTISDIANQSDKSCLQLQQHLLSLQNQMSSSIDCECIARKKDDRLIEQLVQNLIDRLSEY